MKLLMIDGMMCVNPIADKESGFTLPDTVESLCDALKVTCKHLASERLKSTDWYTARFVETGVEIPAAIKAERQAIRDWCDAKEAELDTLEYSDLLKYDATK